MIARWTSVSDMPSGAMDPSEDISVTSEAQTKSKRELKLEKALEVEKSYFDKKLKQFVNKHDKFVDGLKERLKHISVKTVGRFEKTKVTGVDDKLKAHYEKLLKDHIKVVSDQALKNNSKLAPEDEDEDDCDDDDVEEKVGTPKTAEDGVDEVLRWTVKVSSVVKEMTSAVGSVVGTVCTAVEDVGQTIKKLKE